MYRILFVCTANICRSPMAEALFRAQAGKLDESDLWSVRSSGTWAAEDQPASALAIAVMAERGIPLGQHRAHQITRQDVEESNVIITMTRNHRDALTPEFPEHKGKIRLMSELEGREYDIADPYGGSLEEYQVRARELEELIARGYARVKQWAQNSS